MEAKAQSPTGSSHGWTRSGPPTASPPTEDGQQQVLLPDPILPPQPPSVEAPKEPAKEAAKKEETAPPGNFRDIFHFFERPGEKVMLTLAIIFSCLQGFGMPIFSFIFGSMTDSFSETNVDRINELMNKQLYAMIGLAGGILVVATLASFLWNFIAGKQSSRIKVVYFRKLLYQRTTWYDKRKVDQVAANFVDQISSLTAIFSDKMHLFFMSLATVFGGIVVAFIKGWLLTLYILALTPVVFISLGFFMYAVTKSEEVSRESYGEAGAITDECFTYIKTVKSLSGEEHEIARYDRSIAKARDDAIGYSWLYSLGWGLFWGSILIVYGMSYLIGSRLISNRVYNSNWQRDYVAGDVLTIFFCIIIGIMSLGQLGPVMKSISAAKAAVGSILAIIRNEETEACGKYRPEKVMGEFVFENVSFAYPSNPTVNVIKNLNCRILPGQKAALVGQSGCGKSTMVGLLQRYYDPTEGRILLDGVDLREYDLKHLRLKMGLVSQQPMLFADNIRFNVTLGSDVQPTDDQRIWEALDLAEAKDFVERLPRKLDEFVGSMGGQLSGGQKQRIAIARTLIRRPDVFLFDEATSALDRTNEMEIQKTIDNVATGSTSITIAHRLTTIKDSDVIFVMKRGEIVEQGNHVDLVAQTGGIYHNLVKFQLNADAQVDAAEADEVSGIAEDDSLKASGSQVGLPGGSQKDILSQSGSGVIVVNDPTSGGAVDGDKQTETAPVRYKSIYAFLGPEKWMIAVGIIAAMLQGCVMPVFGFLLGTVLQALVKLSCLNDPTLQTGSVTGVSCFGATYSDTLSDIDKAVGGFVGVAVGAFIFTFIQFLSFSILSEKFTFNLRNRYFRRLMYMDMRFHDKTENQPGALSSRLATKCKKVNILVGLYLGTIMMSIFSLIVGIIIAFVFSWRVALVTIAISPLMIIASWVMSKIRVGGQGSEEAKKIDGSEMLTEAINNMRIVRSLTAEEQLLAKFAEYDRAYKQKLLRSSIWAGLLFGLSQFFLFMIYAAVFRISAKFIADGQLTPENMFKSMFALLFGLYGVGQSSQFLSDIEDVKKAAAEMLVDMNEPSLIEVDPKDPGVNARPNKGVTSRIEGQIELRNVNFSYAGRAHRVIRRLNLRIRKGQNTAFVGESGCGKSTIMQLIMRFYDPDDGTILIDGVDIRDYDLAHLRRSFGIVRQEPSLFNGSIEYNVRYNNLALSEQEIWEAAGLANATEFINSTPEGLQRNVGNRGEKLSGGQKQRIAIARVVAQKPQIYLFDEATSALDSQSEELVQKAIERISQMTTSITIAHRISTIKNSDVIFVMEQGHLIEKGSYDQLIARNGKFAELARG